MTYLPEIIAVSQCAPCFAPALMQGLQRRWYRVSHVLTGFLDIAEVDHGIDQRRSNQAVGAILFTVIDLENLARLHTAHSAERLPF